MTKVKLTVRNAQKAVTVPNGLRTMIRKCLETVLNEENFVNPAEVSLTYVDNDEIKRMNSEFRDKDAVTDVLSFPMGENGEYDTDPENGFLMLGDIVISLEKATAQAEEYGHSFTREVCFLATHSMLHLLGYDHVNSKKEEEIMFGKQKAVLDKLGITR